MNLKHVEAFLWISRLGSFSAAARRLNTSQPAISMRIRELEQNLGVTLFDRRSRSMRMTLKGREFADYAQRIMDLTSEAESRLSDRTEFAGRLRLGVTETVALTWLSDLVVHLNEAFPRLVIDINIDLTHVMWRKMRSGELDMIFLPGPAYGTDLVTTYLGSILYTWMASPKLKQVDATALLTPKHFDSVPIITLSEESNLHGIIESWLGRSRSEPRRLDVCNNLGVVAELTMAGLGISMLPPDIFRSRIESGDLFELQTDPPIAPLEFWAVRARQHVSPVTETIAEYARQASTFHFPDRDDRQTAVN